MGSASSTSESNKTELVVQISTAQRQNLREVLRFLLRTCDLHSGINLLDGFYWP